MCRKKTSKRHLFKVVIAIAVIAAIMGNIYNGDFGIMEVNAQEVYADVAQFPRSYQAALYELKQQHPNWVFQMYDTGLDWSDVMYNEMNPANRSLLPSYFDSSMVGDVYGDGWSYATAYAVQYYLDPRNWLKEDYIFQFELLSYNSSTQGIATIQKVLANTFMSGFIQPDSEHNYEEMGLTYAQAFNDIGISIGVSPVHLATRVYQEQGATGSSELISGTYPGYEGYYNYYNIQASGSTREEIVRNGLNEAKNEGWNSRYAALIGGSKKVSSRYILRGQDTLYLQKFDVDGTYDGRYWHQYMQNLAAPSNEGRNVKRAYEKAGMLNESFVFKIPVYNNMPDADNASQIVDEGRYYIESIDGSYIVSQTEQGTDVTIAPLEYGRNNQWMLVPTDNKYYIIMSTDGNKYLRLSEEGFAGGTRVIAETTDGSNLTDTAKWYIKKDSSGNYNICSKYNGMYLSFNKLENGQNAVVYSSNDKYVQSYKLIRVVDVVSASQYQMLHNDSQIMIGLTTETNTDGGELEYYWEIRSADNNELMYASPWIKDNEWLIWEPTAFKKFVVYGCVRPVNDPECISYTVSTFEHHPQIIGTCQMPYTGGEGGYLIGVETKDNPEQSYNYEMLVLDCTLLAEGKDAWIYDTGKFTVTEGNAGWTIWHPQYGYYWTLFRVFDKDGNLLDEECYGFVNAY